jgi:hypothetical protein
MQDRTFDRIAKRVAAQPTRRGFLGGIGALIAGGFAATALGQRRLFSGASSDIPPDSEEEMVALLEQLGQIAQDHNGTCEELTRKAISFDETYRTRIERNRAEEETWTAEHRALHADTYGDRRLAVVEQVQAAQARCLAAGAYIPGKESPGTPVASESATPVASPIASSRGRRVANSELDRALAQAAGACTEANFNFLPESFCVSSDSDWTSPVFQWPAYCPSGFIDHTCVLCDTTTGNLSDQEFCHKYWPKYCGEWVVGVPPICDLGFNHGGGGIAGANCDVIDAKTTTEARCYSRKSDWHSPEFPWPAMCPEGYIDHDCILCSEDPNGGINPQICEKYWPQDCLSETEGNICYIGWHVDETVVCCEKMCPEHTGDCTLAVLVALSGDAICGGCLVQLCGSTSHCLHMCEESNVGCCSSACNRAIVPVIGGERATPITDGTPIGEITPVPFMTATTAPASPTAAPASPTSPPASPTAPPASPTSVPPTPTASPTATPPGAASPTT